MHRTGYEGQLEIQWQLGIFSDTDRLDKNGGPGSPRRFFGDFLCVQKVTRVRGGEPREPKGRIRPIRMPLGLGPRRPHKKFFPPAAAGKKFSPALYLFTILR